MSLVYHCDRCGLNTARVWNLWFDGPHTIPTSNRPPDPLDDNYSFAAGKHLCKGCYEALETFLAQSIFPGTRSAAQDVLDIIRKGEGPP